MKLFYKQLIKKSGQATMLEFSTDTISNISPKHFIMLKRPKLNKEKIASIVRGNYSEQISKGLFSDTMQKKLEVDIKNAIEKEKEKILSLPNPTIFVATVYGLKNSTGLTTLQVNITKETSLYFIENEEHIEEMVFELGTYPFYLKGENLAWSVLESKDEFLKENPYSFAMKDNFEEHTKTINVPNAQKTYKEPKITWEYDVLTEEANGIVKGEKANGIVKGEKANGIVKGEKANIKKIMDQLQ